MCQTQHTPDAMLARSPHEHVLEYCTEKDWFLQSTPDVIHHFKTLIGFVFLAYQTHQHLFDMSHQILSLPYVQIRVKEEKLILKVLLDTIIPYSPYSMITAWFAVKTTLFFFTGEIQHLQVFYIIFLSNIFIGISVFNFSWMEGQS